MPPSACSCLSFSASSRLPAPFLLLDDVTLASRLSNVVAVAMLFLTGYTFGGQVGRPWRAGFLMVIVGVALVAVAMVLGG